MPTHHEERRPTWKQGEAETHSRHHRLTLPPPAILLEGNTKCRASSGGAKGLDPTSGILNFINLHLRNKLPKHLALKKPRACVENHSNVMRSS